MALLSDLKRIGWTKFDFGTNDTVYGTAENDWVNLYGGNDLFIDISGGNDVVWDLHSYNGGNSGKDVISTGVGDDTVVSSLDSTNEYYGGLGTDMFSTIGTGGLGNRIDLAAGTAQSLFYGLISRIVSFENVSGSEFDDVIYGDALGNLVGAGYGNDQVYGQGGNDRLMGNDGNDRVMGGDGSDQIYGNEGNDELYGDADTDYIYGDAGNDRVAGGTGTDWLYGDAGEDTVYGEAGIDLLFGGAGKDKMFGGSGYDYLRGETDDDRLEGGANGDELTGGDGADRFVYSLLSDSVGGGSDVITDFVHGIDKIDVSAIDARAGAPGNQAFSFIGTQGFSGAGQIRYSHTASNTTIISFNTDSDSSAEMTIFLMGKPTLTAVDFVL